MKKAPGWRLICRDTRVLLKKHLTALRAEKPIASTRLKGRKSYVYVLFVPSVARFARRIRGEWEAGPGLDEDHPEHLTHFPKRFFTSPSAGYASRNSRNRCNIPLAPLLHLHLETVHERLLSLESQRRLVGRKGTLSKPST